jgi:hypothetical protein
MLSDYRPSSAKGEAFARCFWGVLFCHFWTTIRPMGLHSTLTCDRCGAEQAEGAAPSLMASLDVPKKQRQVWNICEGCVPVIVAALEKQGDTAPAPAHVVEGEPEQPPPA